MIYKFQPKTKLLVWPSSHLLKSKIVKGLRSVKHSKLFAVNKFWPLSRLCSYRYHTLPAPTPYPWIRIVWLRDSPALVSSMTHKHSQLMVYHTYRQRYEYTAPLLCKWAGHKLQDFAWLEAVCCTIMKSRSRMLSLVAHQGCPLQESRMLTTKGLVSLAPKSWVNWSTRDIRAWSGQCQQ